MPNTCPICGATAPFLVCLEEGPEHACTDHVGVLIVNSRSIYAPVINLTNVGGSRYAEIGFNDLPPGTN